MLSASITPQCPMNIVHNPPFATYSFNQDKGLALAIELGSGVNHLTGGSLNQNVLFTSSVTVLSIIIDPTGLTVRFSQTIRIASKLYFINVNYGTKLHAFLKKIGDHLGSKFYALKPDRKEYGSNGKLTKDWVRVSLIEVALDRVIIYLSSWLISILLLVIKMLPISTNKKVSLLILYYPVLHNNVLFLVLTDISFFGPRMLIQSVDFPSIDWFVSLLCVFLLCVDLAYLASLILDNSEWVNLYKSKYSTNRKSAIQIKEPLTPQPSSPTHTLNRDTLASPFSISLKSSQKSSELIIRQNLPTSEQEAKRPLPSPLISSLATDLRPSASIFTSLQCRFLLQTKMLRLILINSMIIACQHANGLLFSTLLLFESGILVWVIVLYIKYKYLKNIICLLMEVSLRFFLTAFYIIGLAIHRKDLMK